MRKKHSKHSKPKMKGKGIITDVGSSVFPVVGGVLGTVGGTTLGTSIGPIGSAVGGALGGAYGSAAGTGFNDWLRSLGLGSQRLQGRGWVQDLLKKLALKGFAEAREFDQLGAKNYITSLYKKWKSSQQGKGYINKLSQLGSGNNTSLQGYTVSYNGTYQPIQKGMGQTSAYGTISSEFGKVRF